ncbi:MAG: chemotaxis protein CheW [Acidobacteria bacterium]|nr:chemotaxis protein CheW [Acidobacteriota bacterium]
MSRSPHIGFTIGGSLLAVEATRVLAVAEAADIIPVPFARACFPGVLLRRGRLVPIVDLATVPSLWNAVPGTGGDQVLVLAAGEIEAGLLVRQVETLTSAPGDAESGAAAAPSEVREAILWGALRARGRDFGLLKVNTALAAAGVPAPPEPQGGSRVDGQEDPAGG